MSLRPSTRCPSPGPAPGSCRRGFRPRRPFADVLFSQSQAEVGDMGLALVVDQDIARLDVSMHKPLLVGIVQCLGDGGHQIRASAAEKPGLLSLIARSVPSIYLETTKHGNSPCFPHRTRGRCSGDRGRRRCGLRSDTLRHRRGGQSDVGVRHLDGHGPMQLFVVGQVDEAETPFSQESLDPVAADSLRQLWRRSLSDRGMRINLEFASRSQGMAVIHARTRLRCESVSHHVRLAGLGFSLRMPRPHYHRITCSSSSGLVRAQVSRNRSSGRVTERMSTIRPRTLPSWQLRGAKG